MEKIDNQQNIITIQGRKGGQHPCREKILNRIKELGYEKENQILMDQGFARPFKNLKALEESKGDVDRAIQILKEKQDKKKDLVENLLEETGYGPQLKQLQDKGFQAPTKRLLKLLVRFNGDVQTTENFLTKTRERFRSRHQKLSSSSRSRSTDRGKKFEIWDEKIQQLAQKGYTHPNPKRIVKLLEKFEGDVTMVSEKIDKKIQKGKWIDSDTKCEKRQKMDLNEYSEQVSLLIDRGIVKPKLIQKILKVNGKDNQRILEFISRKDDKIENFQKVYAIVQATNCQDVQKIKKHLKRNDGDEKKVIEIIGQKMKDKETLYKKYPEQVKFLILNGVQKPKRMLIALEKNNGDAQKALETIIEMRKEGKSKGGPKGGHFKALQDIQFIEDFSNKEVKYLFVDGNNLIFVNDNIRKAYLKKNKQQATQALTDLIRNWGISKGVETMLIFDSGNVKKISDAANKFTLESARPAFQTSDDYLVDIAEKMDLNTKDQSLFVTSDRGLQLRLKENGITKLMKSKASIESAKKTLGNEVFDIIVNMEVMSIE